MGVAGPVLSAAVPIISSAVTSYKVGKAIGEKIGDSIRDKTLTLINKHRHRLWVVVMYKNAINIRVPLKNDWTPR